MWDIILIIVLIIILGVVIFLLWNNISKSKKQEQLNIIYPFSGILPAPGSNRNPSGGLSLYRSDGVTPQLSCPAGTTLNIIGAYVEVYDPYGSCSPSPNVSYQETCGINLSGTPSVSNLKSCATTSDCGPLQVCTNGVCVPMTCSSHGQCTTTGIAPYPCSGNGPCAGITPGLSYGYCGASGTCEIYPVCGVDNSPTTAQNSICAPGGSGSCKPRDASAYLAAWCDGKGQCLTKNDPWMPNTDNSAFGPLPCQLAAPGLNSGDYTSSTNGYLGLPVVTSWNNVSSSGTSNTPPPDFKQGYYVHGLFTCIPN